MQQRGELMNTDKKELYQRLEKLLNTQDLDKWAAEKTKPRIDEVIALVKRAVKENKEKSLVCDELQELKPFFISYPSEQFDEYLRTIRSKTTSLDGICLLQVLLPAKKLPSYEQATDKAIKKAEALIKKISMATKCNAETAGFLAELLIQSICHTTYYLYNQDLYLNFQNKSTEIATQIEAALNQITEPKKDTKNDKYYNERDRLMVDLNKVIEDLFASMYNYNKADRIAADIISELYPEQKISPTETPKEIEGFYLLAQSQPSNQLVKKLTERITRPAQFDLYGNASIIDKDFRLFVKGYRELINGVNETAARLLDSLMITATRKSLKNTLVVLPLKEYMDMRGLKDEKAIRQQIKRDLNALERISFEYKGIGRNKGVWLNVSIYGGTKGQIKNGDIVFRFNQDFFESFKEGAGNKYLFMYFPHEALTGRIKENPWKYWLGRKISEHKRMNIGKDNEDIISVQTLIEACPNFPTYERVMSEDRAINRRIIEPFDRDLTALEPSITWEYQGLSESPQTYQEFINAKIIIHWATYPDTTKLAEEKKKRARKIAQIKQKNGKKRGGETQQKGG